MYKAVHEPLVLPSQPCRACSGWRRMTSLLARALAKQPAQTDLPTRCSSWTRWRPRSAGCTTDSISSATITALMPPPLVAPGRPGHRLQPAGAASAPTTWPWPWPGWAGMWGRWRQVMVKRVARDCPDLPTLYARLAEQVTDPTASGLRP